MESETARCETERRRQADERAKRFFTQNCPEAKVGMKLLHSDYGELVITKVERLSQQVIIYVEDSQGMISSKCWNVLWACNKVKIV